MKRPIGIYFVLCWLFIIYSIQMRPILAITQQYNLNNQEIPTTLQLIVGGLLVLLIYTMIGLFQLKNLNRRIAIILFLLFSIAPIFQFVFRFKFYENYNLFLIVSLIYLIPNSLAILYLLSTKFDKHSNEFRKEKAQKQFLLKVK